MVVNYTKVQFNNNSRHSDYEEESENVEYGSIIDKFTVKMYRKINLK